jgi:Flp pilus assembly protein TadD
VISSRYANVLTLRTGWGIQRSYSRRAVARMLHVSLAREGRIEHAAVRALGTADTHGSCARTQQATRSALFMDSNELALLGQSVPRAFTSGASSQSSHTASKAKSGHHRSSVSAASTAGVPGSIPSLPHPGTSSFPWLFVILGLVVATALASPVARRRWLHPRTFGGPVPGHGPRRPGAGISGRAAERAGAVGAAAAAGAAALRSKRPRRAGKGRAHPSPNGGEKAKRTRGAPAHGAPGARAGGTRDAAAKSAARTPKADEAAAAAAGMGAVAAGAGAAASKRDRSPTNGDPAAASSLGARLERQGDVDGALAAYRRADAGGDAAGATNLGVLLEQRGDLDGALDAYRRADHRGDANGSFNLGCLLADRGDMKGAVAALQRADERGDPAGASNLGVLLEQQGDLDGALAAYRRADERGDANGSFNLGLLLANRGDLPGAEEAYRRAAERGDSEVVDRARSALAELSGNGEQPRGDD